MGPSAPAHGGTQEIKIEEMVPVVVGGATNGQTIGVPASKADKFVNDHKGKNGEIPTESLDINAVKTNKEPTHQVSTIAWLFLFFGVIFAGSYAVHRMGGPQKVEAKVDRFFLRAKQAITGGRGRYQGLPR